MKLERVHSSKDIVAEWLRRQIRNLFRSRAQVRVLSMSEYFFVFARTVDAFATYGVYGTPFGGRERSRLGYGGAIRRMN